MITRRKSGDRGHANHGWLDSFHTFSFAEYHDSRHMGFRSLRVLNEDRVAGGGGFGRHPHRDFEIISYVISGELKHADSLGHSAVMKPGEVQRISAGTGIEHSEFNNSAIEPVHFLQVWIQPSEKGLAPGYAQASFAKARSPLTLACSSDGREGSIKINQDAEMLIGRLDAGSDVARRLRYGSGWVQVIEGDLDINGTRLSAGDGAAIEGEENVRLASTGEAHLILFDL